MRWLWSSGLPYDAPLPVGEHHLAGRLVARGEALTWLSPHRPLVDRSLRLSPRARGYRHPDGVFEIVPATLLPSRDFFPLDQPWVARHWARFTVPPLSALLRARGLHRPDVLWLSQGSNARGLAKRFPGATTVLRLSDLYSELPGSSGVVERGLAELLPHAQLILATSEAILDALPHSVLGRARTFPNGVDHALFSRFDGLPPAEYPSDRPVVVFAGGLGSWIDFDAIEHLAREVDAEIVLIGPLRPEGELPRARNIQHVPWVPYPELPRWLTHAQVGIVPFVDSEFTRAVSSNKVLQYLAAGLEVVCMNLPEAQRLGDAVVHADSAPAFAEAVRNALSHGRSREEQQRVASAHDWGIRVDELMAALREIRA